MAEAATSVHSLAKVNRIELAYLIQGSGKPLVLLPGSFCSAEMFGPTLAALAGGRQVIGVDLQSHGRTPAADRPMRCETMADDVAALIRQLGHKQADVMGFSLGGGVALRTAIQHPALVRRLVVVSWPFKRDGWYPEMVEGFDHQGPEMVEQMKQTPMYEIYRKVAPRPQDWPILVSQITTLVKLDYDWTAEVKALPMPVLIVAGDADGLPPRHAVEFFELLGGGKRDAVWDGSGMTRHGLAILPRVTHYDMDVAPALATTVASFLDAPD
jgi:pimeloyl-ACP methyl ester carboxylesterase